MTIELPIPPEAEPVQCEGCDLVYRQDEVFDGLCHHCYFIEDEEYAESQRLDVLYEAELAEQADRQNDDSKLRF